MIEGFEYSQINLGPTNYRPGVAGDGPPVLLLHRFPQTHHCWHRVGPGLAQSHTVVVSDLKGTVRAAPSPADGGPLPSGHFIPEEPPEELLASLRRFLAQAPAS